MPSSVDRPTRRSKKNFRRSLVVDSDDDDITILEAHTNRSSKEVKEEKIEAGRSKHNLAAKFKDVTIQSPVAKEQEIILLSDSDNDGDRIFIYDEELNDNNRTAVKPEGEDVMAMEQVEIQLSSRSNSNTHTDTAVEKDSSEDTQLEEKVDTGASNKNPKKHDRRRFAVKASRRSLDLVSSPAKPIRRISAPKDKLTLDAEKRQEREVETKERISNVKKVADRIATLTYTRGGREFNDLHKAFETLLRVNSHFSTKYCKFLLNLANDKEFLDKVYYTAPECNISKLDNRTRDRAVDMVTDVHKQPRIPRRRPAIKNIGARPFSFARWADDQGEMTIRYEKTVANGKAFYPLGVVFDGERFFFSGGNKIFSCDEDGKNLVERLTDLRHPSALCVVKPESSIGFLENDRISIYYKHGGDVKIVATLRSNDPDRDLARGLTYVSCGALVTAQRENGGTYLKCYDIQETNKLKTTYRYGLGLPSFMSSYDDIIYVTDLDNRTIRSFKIEKIEQNFTISPVNECRLDSLPPHVKCEYPSGIVCDSRRELLVVDARRYGQAKIIWGDSFLQNWKKISVINGNFPYCSQIAVSPSGTLFAACRQSHCMMIFKITS